MSPLPENILIHSNVFAEICMKLSKISYKTLNPKQQEIHNFQIVAGLLAAYGFNCIKLADDWQGADFLAYHINGNDTLKVQLKSRCTIDKKYNGKAIYMVFPISDSWYLIKHEKLVHLAKMNTTWLTSQSWSKGRYSSARPGNKMVTAMMKYQL